MPTLSALLPSQLERTIVRPLRADDLSRFHEYRSSEELARYQGWTPMSKEQAMAFLETNGPVKAFVPGEWAQLGIAERDTDDLIGDVGIFLDQDGKCAEIGFTLDHGGQGQGHAARAARMAVALVFATTNASEVRAVTDARNSASVRVLKMAGFAFVTEQQAVFKGQACTEHVYVNRRSAA